MIQSLEPRLWGIRAEPPEAEGKECDDKHSGDKDRSNPICNTLNGCLTCLRPTDGGNDPTEECFTPHLGGTEDSSPTDRERA